MAIQFGSTFQDEFNKFRLATNAEEFQSSVLPFAQFVQQIVADTSHPMRREVIDWRVTLFNQEAHILYAHQIKAVEGCLREIVFSDNNKSGYCFMPTSAGKGHILITLAACAVGDFILFKHLNDTNPNFLEDAPYLLPIFISLSLEYAKLVSRSAIIRTQVLVHDVEILDQIQDDAKSLLGDQIASKIEFYSVQALGSEARRKNLKYVIIDECHWGNASEYETIQSDLVSDIKNNGGLAFGFTASPYEHPDGKFQKTWSKNKINAQYDFNYYLNEKIIYPVHLREVNLQNARPDFSDGGEELDLTEKRQVIEYIVSHMMTTFPENELDGPGICYFSPFLIPDIVEGLLTFGPKSKILKGRIKVLASDSADFRNKCAEKFGEGIIATDADIRALKKGEKILLISAQKLLVGLNAPLLRYCFISPTNSKIKIMQAIGRLMRPTDMGRTPRKLATLFLTSLSGKKLDLAAKDGEAPSDMDRSEQEAQDPDGEENPKTRYIATSMTLSEAYDLPIKVFYKNEVGFREFINQTLINNPNAVERLKTTHIPKDELDKFDPIKAREDLNRLRDICRTNYKPIILKRDQYRCQGKQVVGKKGCDRGHGEVPLDIHHKEPFTFNVLYKQFGWDGTIEWHRNSENLKHLVTLCPSCHKLVHDKAHADGGRETA